MTRSELLVRLLAATPPPPANASSDQLLAAAQAMLAARTEILADHAEVPGFADPDGVGELEIRTAAWTAALAIGRARVGTARMAAAKARAYRQSPRR
jgi:hypothetical protein